MEPTPPRWRDAEGKATEDSWDPERRGYRNAKEDCGPEGAGVGKEGAEAVAGAVMGQGTCLEDRWDVYIRAAVEGGHPREETKLEATLGPQTAPLAGVVQVLLPSSPLQIDVAQENKRE